jgi:hypothetical protein
MKSCKWEEKERIEDVQQVWMGIKPESSRVVAKCANHYTMPHPVQKGFVLF